MLNTGRIVVGVIGGAEALYFGFVAVISLVYGEFVNLAVAGGFGVVAAVALIGGLATLQRRPSGGVLVALASGTSLALYLALGYSEPWWLILLGLATVVAIVYALAFGRTSEPGSPAS